MSWYIPPVGIHKKYSSREKLVSEFAFYHKPETEKQSIILFYFSETIDPLALQFDLNKLV